MHDGMTHTVVIRERALSFIAKKQARYRKTATSECSCWPLLYGIVFEKQSSIQTVKDLFVQVSICTDAATAVTSTMGQTRSMVIVPSLNPDADRALLQEILPFQRQTTQDQEEEAIILLWQEECLVLVPSIVASTASWVLASSSGTADWEQVRKACLKFMPNRTKVLTEIKTRGLQFVLPSGSTLLITTAETLASERDRRALAKYCRMPSTSSSSTVPSTTSNGNNGNHNVSAVSPTRHIPKVESSSSMLSEMSGDNDSRASSARKSRPKETAVEAPPLNTLSVKMIQEKDAWDTNFALNTREPYPFETELFQGQILMLVRPLRLDDDPYWSERIFSKKKRSVVFNIQGKFKRPLRGPLYVGGEITSSMNLSLFTRGILSMLIKLLESGFSDLRYSFGDEKKKLCPRIAVPAFSGMERLVVTPPDKTPPPLTGDPFEESKEDRAKRIKATDWEWNTTHTYSFSFFSMYLSLADWKLVNLPVSRDINLRRLWNDGDFRLVMYEKTGTSKEHPASSLSYALNINFRYLGDKHVSEEGEEASSGPEDFEDIALDTDRSHRYAAHADETESGYTRFHRSESNSIPAIMEGDSSSDEEDFYDARSEMAASSHGSSVTPSDSAEMLVAIDLLVPAWLHVADGKGHYTRVYAVNQGESTLFLSAHECDECLEAQAASDIIRERVGDYFSPRLSTHERSRRCLGLFVKTKGERAIDILEQKSSPYHDQFLQHKSRNTEKATMGTRLQGFAARAVSDRHWEEEWVVLSEDGVLSCYHPEKVRKVRLRIQASSILKASILPHKLAPSMEKFGFFTIETLGRTIYFLCDSPETRDKWLQAIWDLQKSLASEEQSVNSEFSRRIILNIGQPPSEEFLHKSGMWHYKHRRVLNCGEYSLKSTRIVENPLDMVTEALQLSIQAYRDESGEKRHLFFKSAGALKRAGVQTLLEKGRLAFFLNLYHCMVMHAFLVLGPPGSGLKWISFFNNLAYEVGDDLFSISELEHCIIRSKMAHPAQFMSRFVIPKSGYRMALQNADFRINFALNPGSTSSPSTVLVYSPETVDEQLNKAASMYLEHATSVTKKISGGVVVTLPRICQWFQEDFGTQEELLKKIVQFVKEDDRLVLERAMVSQMNVNLRFSEFSFKCKPLVLG